MTALVSVPRKMRVGVRPTPEEMLDVRQRLSAVHATLSRLNPRTREILLMHRLDGLRYREIAGRLGISLHRGPQERGQLDMTVRYRVLNDWIVKLQAVNLLDDNLNLGYGEDLSMRRAEMKKGLTFYFNIIYKT